MACDEALLHSAIAGETTLRFYRWTPATLSLGYFQPRHDRELHIASASCPQVRRATGGGAIVHDQELTYSFACPGDHPWMIRPGRAYDLFHEAIILALARWGISARQVAETAHPDRPRPPDAARCESETGAASPFLCFQRHCRGDVLMDRHKVVGSAQRRHARAVLQHGSILLATSPCAPELPGIRDLGGREVTGDDLADSIVGVLADRTGLVCQNDDLTPHELSEADRIETTRFTSSGWTNRR